MSADDDRLSKLTGVAQDGNSQDFVPGFGPCTMAVASLNVEPDTTRIMLVRLREDGFRPDEMLLLHGMAWILDLALRQQRLVTALNERQRLLEQVSQVQRAIAGRAPLPEVFHTITNGASNLLGSDLSTMHLVHNSDLEIASTSAGPGDHLSAERSRRLAESVAQTVLRTGALTHLDEQTAHRDHAVAIGAPVHENGNVVGGLVVVSARPGQSWSPTQEQSLLTFAEQVSLALSDARLSAMAEQAFHDPLTGLATRTVLLDRLERALRQGSRVEVMFLDLDNFKPINDSMGHAAGDDLLQQVARRLRVSVREGVCVARLGGDEFAILLEGESQGSARDVGQRILSAFTWPFLLDSHQVSVGVSIGIGSGEQPAEASDVLHKADIAMYRSKQSGGGRVTDYGGDAA
jgi:diguanylate cyclase (GGDEF)-like protein